MKRIVALLLCLVLNSVYLVGCTDQDQAYTQKSYTRDAGQISEVCIDVRDRKIEVIRSPDNQVHIGYFENGKEYYNISVSEDHRLTMTSENNKNWTDYIGGKSSADSRTITLQIPDNRLSTLLLSTTNETISLPALTVTDDISLSTNSGNLEFGNLNAGNTIKLKTKNGEISGSLTGSYDDYSIFCDIKKGESNLPSSKENGAKTLMVSNNNGDIAIEFLGE